MKRFLLFALCAIVALAGCQKIDEPVITPEQSSFKVSAVIDDNSTKVTYEVTDDAVTPSWAEGDKILVYDGTNTAELTVESVGTDGVATFADGYTPTEGATTLHAVYYPGKATEDFADGEMKVDLTNQNGAIDGTTPAIMCATATVSGDEVRFRFYNQTAIIGVKKFQVSPNEEIKYLSIKGLTAKGAIKVVNGTLSLVPSTEKMDITVNFDPAISADGDGLYSNPIYFMALPTEGAQIGVAASSATFTHCNTTAINVTDIEAGQYYYLSKKLDTDDTHVARYSNNGGATWTYTESLADAIDGITTTAKADGKVELLKDITIGSQVKISSKKFTWNGNGHTVSFVSKYSEITDNYQGGIHVMSSSDVDFTGTKFIGQGTSVTATDRPFAVVASTASFGKDVTISDFKNSRPYGGAIWGNKQSVIYLKDNLKITNCHNAPASSSYGGGALCSDGSVYVQDDVLISNCSSDFWGGAILSNYSSNNSGKSMLIMSGRVRIENCTSGKGGGGFYGNGKIELSDEVAISHCEAGTNGGAFESRKEATLSDKVLIENCSATYGGAVYIESGTLNIEGGTINSCSVSGSGGAVYNKGGEVNMSAGTISNCKASSNNGGAIYNPSTFNMSGGTISGCSAKYGGGIDNRKTLSFTGGTITECSASLWGGGIYNTASATTTIDGGKISACTGSYGAGISVYSGSVTLNSGSVSADKGNPIAKANNTANTCTININGGSVLSSATGGSAISFDVKGGTLNVYGGTIEAKGPSAYAVYNYQGTVNIEDGTLTSAYRVGYVKAGSININGGRLLGNDGIYVVSNTDAETKLIIKGGEMNFTNSSSNCAWFYTNSASDKIITLDVQGGKFNCGAYVFGSTGSISGNGKGMPEGSVKKISGGLFYAYTGAMSTMASNAGCKFSAEKNADGYYTVIPQ